MKTLVEKIIMFNRIIFVLSLTAVLILVAFTVSQVFFSEFITEDVMRFGFVLFISVMILICVAYLFYPT